MTAADRAALDHALAAQDAGQDQHAELILKELVGKYPSSFEAKESLGLLYAGQNRYQAALPLLESASTLTHSSVAYANLGAAYLKLSRDHEAVGALRQAVALDPANALTQSNLGLALMHVHEAREAAVAFSRATDQDSSNGDLLYNWALALFTAGDYVHAREVLSRIPSSAGSDQVQSLFADVEEKLGHYQQAVEHAQAAVDLEPSEQNLYALGLEFLMHWTFDPAVKVFTYGSSRYPDSQHLLLGLGIAKYASNDFAAAAPIFAKLLTKDPDNALYADLLGHNCGLMPDAAEGCDQLVSFASYHPENAPACTFAAASILHRPSDQQDLGLAKQLLDRAIAADPKLPEARYQMGILDQQQGVWDKSVEPLERAVALKPDFSKAHYHLALAYRHTGQTERAQQEIVLQQKFSRQEKDDLNAKFKQVTTFLIAQH